MACRHRLVFKYDTSRPHTCLLILNPWIGISVRDSGALRFFCIQPLGVIVEDIVHYVNPTNGPLVTSRSPALQHCLGYIWVTYGWPGKLLHTFILSSTKVGLKMTEWCLLVLSATLSI
ncbi:hypothetical protein F4804DRAFT_293152 [Jackrogersella minutella]|nr:hypothetical protein F4804DRAFT_293152 [Jackrogersella minutella]